MTETIDEQLAPKQQFAAAMMAAVADLLVGEQGLEEALNERNAVMFGAAPNFPTLLHWGDWVRRNGRPILHLYFDPEVMHVPMMAVVDFRNGQTSIFEGCFLWLGEDGREARIIPDNFKSGSYAIDKELRLQQLNRAPAPNSEAAESGIILASRRLSELVSYHMENSGKLRLPLHLQERQAA
jgi:hypothetical protein